DRERALGRRLVECCLAHHVVIFRRTRGARDDATDDDNAVVAARRFAHMIEQRVLAGAARADHEDEMAGADQIARRRCHATRRPSRHTLRTTGIVPTLRTRMRSARRPGAISPRSARPTASAGVLVTVRTAVARSMPSHTVGITTAAASRL